MNNSGKNFDIVIVGGGLAGSLLALKLKRKNPTISICILEKRESFFKKVGESTSDISAMYLRRLGIDHLLEKHLVKTGLRFIFENGNEFSSPSYKSIANGYQLDRSIFDHDLLVEVEGLGVTIYRGASFKSFTREDSINTIHFIKNHKEENIYSKWIVDASGRSSVIALKQLNWIVKNDGLCGNLSTSATWSHFTDIPKMAKWDLLKSKEWSDEAIGPKDHSTCHFMGEGYWVWYIPLKDNSVSIGVVYDNKLYQGNPRDIFWKLSTEHKVLGKFITKSKANKFYHYENLAYYPKQVYCDGVVALGDSCMFADPLFSPGMELVVQQVEWVHDLLCKSLSRTDTINSKDWDHYQNMIIKSAMSRIKVYHKRYRTFNNFNAFCAWTYMDFMGYYWFHVLPAAYFPKLMKYPVKLNFLTSFLYSTLTNLYLKIGKSSGNSAKDSGSSVVYSRLWIPKKSKLIQKYIELLYLWSKSLLKLRS